MYKRQPLSPPPCTPTRSSRRRCHQLTERGAVISSASAVPRRFHPVCCTSAFSRLHPSIRYPPPHLCDDLYLSLVNNCSYYSCIVRQQYEERTALSVKNTHQSSTPWYLISREIRHTSRERFSTAVVSQRGYEDIIPVFTAYDTKEITFF